ncbi:MAG: ParA family protein [Christensenellaceae bacterium]
MTYTYFCKKGGVGKTTICGEHAAYLASQGKKVLIVSIDDQNSIFELFGKSALVFNRDDNYFEHLIANCASFEDVLIPVRENICAVKTLNTDMLSKKLTIERSFERTFLSCLKDLCARFDAVFFDLPPSSNRTSEIVLDFVDKVVLVVELNKLGVNGFYNTVQYFVDCGLDTAKIRFILPNGFSKRKSVPLIALDELKEIAAENLPEATILPCMPEKNVLQVLQNHGVSAFDSRTRGLSSYARSQKKEVSETLTALFDRIENG